MHIPILDANTAASYQAYSAIIQGIATIIALVVAIGVPIWQQRKGRKQDEERRSSELAGLRLALHTEVGVIALQCIAEQTGWSKAAASAAYKNIRTAKLPQLVIYTGNAGRVGLLSRDEIVSLIKLRGTLHDIATVVDDIEQRQGERTDDYKTLQMLFANACGCAAEFFEAVPDIEGAYKDRDFVRELKARFKSMDDERAPARREFAASLLSVREGS